MGEQYELDFTEDADRQLEKLSARDRAIILDAVERQLEFQPTVKTRNRKPLRSPTIAAWELRVGDFRVFYDVEEKVKSVHIVAVGEKRHNTLYIEGEETGI
jgi:mRNA-degrading endonuclease RelE of RelBE toxin-antitoxin system